MNSFDKENPFSLFDSEICNDDFNFVRCCKDCGSMNIEFDMSLNQIKCRDCKDQNFKSFEKKSSESVNEERLEKETQEIQKAVKLGVKFETLEL
jgi:ribosomal protein S27E